MSTSMLVSNRNWTIAFAANRVRKIIRNGSSKLPSSSPTIIVMNRDKMNQKKITHVIFDLDGLILDTEQMYERITINIVGRYGKQFTAEHKFRMLGRPGLVAAQMLIADLQLPMDINEFMKQFDEEYKRIAQQHPVPIMPGAERLIRHLHQHRIPIAVATGSRRFTYELNVKHHRPLFKLFSHVLLASDDPEVTRGKPDPQPFSVCAKRFIDRPVSDPSRILVFEDSLVGIEAANRAGMTTVWVPDYRLPTGKRPEPSSSVATPKWTLDSLGEFLPDSFGLPAYDDNDDDGTHK